MASSITRALSFGDRVIPGIGSSHQQGSRSAWQSQSMSSQLGSLLPQPAHRIVGSLLSVGDMLILGIRDAGNRQCSKHVHIDITRFHPCCYGSQFMASSITRPFPSETGLTWHARHLHTSGSSA
jgi:hypothetical protein